MMLLFFVLLAVFQLGLALALNPSHFRQLVKGCDAKIEDAPWHITNFVVFEKKRVGNHSSYISFDFMDINDRLELNTTCIRTVFPNSTVGLASEEWSRCDNDDVALSWDGKKLEVSRHYEDKCLGPSPYNTATAFGRITPNTTRTTAVDGVYVTKAEMHVPISSLS